MYCAAFANCWLNGRCYTSFNMLSLQYSIGQLALMDAKIFSQHYNKTCFALSVRKGLAVSGQKGKYGIKMKTGYIFKKKKKA